MKIEIWSDFVCPFCYIGKRNLEQALESFQKEDVTIEFKSFQLDPSVPEDSEENYLESLARKFGDMEKARQVTSHVREQAKALGLEFQFETMKQANTYHAHRLFKYADKNGRGLEFAEALFHAHFVESLHIGEKKTLTKLATSVGLPEPGVKEVLEDETQYAAQVVSDLQQARHFNITGVPFFIFNEKYSLAGAHPTEFFAQALERIQEQA